MKRIILLMFVFLITSCATTAKYEALLNTWVGSDINSLINSWGYPTDSFVAPNGNKVYVYQQGGSFTMPTTYQTTANVYGYGNYAYGTATTNVYGGQTITLWCRTFFEVDKSNRIIRWSWQGNNCKSRYESEESYEQSKNVDEANQRIKEHFNSKMNKHFRYIQYVDDKRESLYEIKEGKNYGEFRISKDNVVCVIKDRPCKSREQWNAYVNEMMEE